MCDGISRLASQQGLTDKLRGAHAEECNDIGAYGRYRPRAVDRAEGHVDRFSAEILREGAPGGVVVQGGRDEREPALADGERPSTEAEASLLSLSRRLVKMGAVEVDGPRPERVEPNLGVCAVLAGKELEGRPADRHGFRPQPKAFYRRPTGGKDGEVVEIDHHEPKVETAD